MYQTNKDIKKKKVLKRILLSFLLLLTIWVGFGVYLNLNDKNKQLENIGYSNIEISVIRDILKEKSIKIIYNYDYIENLTDLLVDSDFKQDKLNNYLSYYIKYPTISNNDLIYIVNNDLDDIEYNDFTKVIIHEKEFRKENSNRYNKYYNKYKLSTEEVLYAVNNNLDKYDIKYDKKYDIYINENYSIIANIDRYYEYNKLNKKKSIDEIIKEVNSNLDLTPYIDSNEADTKLNEKILVNRYYYLNAKYIPDNLVKIEAIHGNGEIKEEVYSAFKNMYDGAKENNINLYISRGYINYEEQEKLYYQSKYYYERPGFSESQTGLVIELFNNNWLEENAYRYGFIKRFPSGKSKITGYNKSNYYRYVGTEIAKFIHNNNITYEEYYAYFIEQSK